jgi:ATP-dependent Clp protease ATP-binding subunit ClpC
VGSREELHLRIELSSLGRDLTALARDDRLPPLEFRWDRLRPLMSLLANGQPVLLVGESGAGKTALVESVAHLLARDDAAVPPALHDRRILECPVATFQFECLYVNEFETRVQHIIRRCREDRVVLFVDRVEEAVVAGACEGKDERTLANLLLPYLADSRLAFVGATTPEGYRFMLRHNPSFASRFAILEVPPVSRAEMPRLFRSLSARIRRQYGVALTASALTEAIHLGERFYPWRAFPGTAVDLVRETVAVAACSPPAQGWVPESSPGARPQRVTGRQVRAVFCGRRGLPRWLVDPEQTVRREELIAEFETELFGQTQAVEAVVDALLTFKADLNDRTRPIAAFLLAGPTGVGKTQLAKATARILFGSEERMMRYDMAEYAHWETIAALVGGRVRTGRRSLVAEVLAQPFAVILLDEIEKAHPHVQALLLSVLGEGRLTDDAGRTANFANTVIFMTSNVGADLYGRSAIGFHQHGAIASVTEHEVRTRVSSAFLPEFINRLTQIIICPPLMHDTILRIAERELRQLTSRTGLRRLGLALEPDRQALAVLAQRGFSPEYGARQMKRAVEELVVKPLAEMICAGRSPLRCRLRLTVVDGQLVFEPMHRNRSRPGCPDGE